MSCFLFAKCEGVNALVIVPAELIFINFRQLLNNLEQHICHFPEPVTHPCGKEGLQQPGMQ